MKTFIKKRLVSLFVLSGFIVMQFPIVPAIAASPGSIVINEVAWAGSTSSANDEWIELYNTSNQPIDLTGWKILDDGPSSVYELTGTIAAHGYYVIEDSDTAVNPLSASAIVNMSLANSGDSLQLVDNNSQVIDTVNGSGGMWYAGDSTTKASMERISALASGDDPANWATSTGAGSTTTDSGGSLIIGTPGLVNSAIGSPVNGASTTVSFQPSSTTLEEGSTVDIAINVTGVQNLFSYGFEITYDPGIFSYQSATKGSFLSKNGTITTSFQHGKQNNQEGTLLLAEAITNSEKTGVNGNGTLATFTLTVISEAIAPSEISFSPTSFLATPNNDILTNFTDTTLVTEVITPPAQNLQITQAASRYALQLTWTGPAGVTDYKVYRKDPQNNWKLLGDTQTASFIDSDATLNGGKLIPSHSYNYRVIAVKNNTESLPLEGSGQETRGIKGDNDRSDRVDGRDLDNLARHFGENITAATFDQLIDTTYDGLIDGSDLIDLGVNFALTYSL